MKKPSRDLRRSITNYELYELMRDRDWLSIIQIITLADEKITPECAVRHFLSNVRGGASHKAMSECNIPLDVQISRGKKYVISSMLSMLVKRGYIAKKPAEGIPCFRITKKGIELYEKHKARKTSPGRQHAVPHKGKHENSK